MAEWIISSCLLIVTVLVLRAVLGKKISAGLRYGLWAVVLVRLLVPVPLFTLPGTAGKIPVWEAPETMRERSIFILPVDSRPLEDSGVFIMDDGNLGDPNSFGCPKLTGGGETVVRYADKISPLELLGWAWRAGTAVMTAVLAVSNLRFTVRLRRIRKPLAGTSAPIPVYTAEAVPTPCLVGLLHPAVYVPDGTASDPVMLRHVLAHELTHYNHLDHLWGVLRGAALAVHWWNPLVWLAVVYSRRDGELACDEGALKQLGDSERAAYGETLLTLITAKSKPADLFHFATTMTSGKRSLKERFQRIAKKPKYFAGAMAAVIVILSLSAAVAFGRVQDAEGAGDGAEVPSTASASADDPRPYSPDLDRDGESELVYVRQPENYPEEGEWRLEIQNKSSEILWSVTLDETHGGCGTFFLYQQDGLDYLLAYMPKMQQGYCAYSYRLFHLADGKEVTDAENSLEFDINFDSPDHKFDPVEIRNFMHEVNAIIGESQLLLNTNHWMLSLEEDANGRTRDNILQAIGYKGGTDYQADSELLTKLGEFADYANDHPDDIESPLGVLLAELDPEDIGDISGQDVVTAGELAACLREVSASRSSRYHAYDSFEEEEAWTWSMGEWAVPLANGGTLHLLACDSGNVEMSYETDNGAFSAFYYQPEELHTLILRAGMIYPARLLPYDADLDRDGTSDDLVLSSESDDGTAWSLRCHLSSGGTWETEANSAHAGWNAVFLCRMDGQDYLLQYVPYFGQMHGEYHYKLFYLDPKTAEEAVVQENTLEFQISPGGRGQSSGDPVYGDTSPEEIAAFMDEINTLLAGSTQLLNTDRYLKSVFTNEGRLYDSMIFLQETWEKDKSLLENLLIYRNRILEDAAVGDVSVMEAITEENIINAVLEDGTQISKAVIVDILRGDERGTSFRDREDWEPQGQAIKVTYNSPGDTGDQTLTLQAGTSEGENYVHVIFEGVKTVLQYSENPDVDGTYLHDVPYRYDGYIYTEDIYERIASLTA